MIARLALIFVCLFSAAAAKAEWREASSRNFVIYSEQSERDLRIFAENLERFDWLLRRHFNLADEAPSPSTRLVIYVLRDLNELNRFFNNRSIAGIYLPRHSGSIAFTTRSGRRAERISGQPLSLTPEIVLYHEYTHHFLFNNFAFGAPLWLSEGLPEFWSTVQFQPDGRINYGVPALHRAGELFAARPMHVRDLLTIRLPIRNDETEAVVYGRGWLLSHFLSFQPERRGQFTAYLRALGQGRSAEEAAQVFGDLNRLNQELERYAQRSRMSAMTVPAGSAPVPSVTIRTVTPAEEAIMRVRMRSKRGVTPEEAQRLVVDARRVAAPFANDPAAQVMLAEAEFDADNYELAEAAADRALAADPRLVDALLYKGRSIMARLSRGGNATPAQWSAARVPITAANRIDPENPEPMVLFYQSFEMASVSPTANAVEGLIYAQRLAPEDRSLRLMAGRALLIGDRAEEARRLLLPLTTDSHSGSVGILVAEVVAILARGDTAAARARLERGPSEAAQTNSDRDQRLSDPG